MIVYGLAVLAEPRHNHWRLPLPQALKYCAYAAMCQHEIRSLKRSGEFSGRQKGHRTPRPKNLPEGSRLEQAVTKRGLFKRFAKP